MLAIGHDWSPIAESMPTIMYKVLQLNRLNKTEMTKIFGNSQSSFSGGFSGKAIDGSYFNFNNIRKIVGWTMDDLKPSFPSYYLAYCGIDLSVRQVNDYFPLSKTLRICDSCFKEGCHLLLHQSPVYEKCPIHFRNLITHCPGCSSPLRPYQVTFDLDERMGCSSCSYCLSIQTKPHNGLSVAKRRLVTQYAGWIEAISSLSSTVNISTSRPKSYNQILLYSKIRKPPTWILKSISPNVKQRISTKKTLVNVKPNNALTTKLHSATSIDGVLNDQCGSREIEIQQRRIETQFKKQLKSSFEITEKKIAHYFPWFSEEYGTYLNAGEGKVGFYFGHRQSRVSQSLEILRDEVDSLISPSLRFVNSSFWTDWAKTPGALLGIQERKNGVLHTINKKWTIAYTEFWFRENLQTIFKLILLSSFLTSESRRSPLRFGGLSNLRIHFDCEALFILVRENNNIKIKCVRQLSGLQDFKDIISKEVDFSDESMNQNYKVVNSVGKLCRGFNSISNSPPKRSILVNDHGIKMYD